MHCDFTINIFPFNPYFPLEGEVEDALISALPGVVFRVLAIVYFSRFNPHFVPFV
jgi:hypothetical protein